MLSFLFNVPLKMWKGFSCCEVEKIDVPKQLKRLFFLLRVPVRLAIIYQGKDARPIWTRFINLGGILVFYALNVSNPVWSAEDSNLLMYSCFHSEDSSVINQLRNHFINHCWISTISLSIPVRDMVSQNACSCCRSLCLWCTAAKFILSAAALSFDLYGDFNV